MEIPLRDRRTDDSSSNEHQNILFSDLHAALFGARSNAESAAVALRDDCGRGFVDHDECDLQQSTDSARRRYTSEPRSRTS